jgi:hypothetical protein
MTLKQIDAALAELLRLGLVEKVRDGEGVERFSPVEMVNHHGEIAVALRRQ